MTARHVRWPRSTQKKTKKVRTPVKRKIMHPLKSNSACSRLDGDAAARLPVKRYMTKTGNDLEHFISVCVANVTYLSAKKVPNISKKDNKQSERWRTFVLADRRKVV